ncbi:MarR family winged helix-turn-helix transcriptional regulator [Breoghania sp. L-A4]|uniref:MarR family winged helix-turn-helix transcriptional regulator n=1 Tax=Breoghania sp. L-A4 TaxID=2304600 RepID=UPI000E35CCAB|nr:MarR family transcriptional regulator [Breoghania sp. L-A4]
MGFNYKKSITFRLAQAAKAHRARSGIHLARIGMHPGQEAVLKTLADTDGLTMSELAATLGVQPPTVTKMITRMSGQRLVRRQAAEHDGRLAQVCLTDEGRARVELIDRCWKRLEREALAGLEDKDRKRLRKLLRVVERNLAASFFEDPTLDDEIDAEDLAAGGDDEAAEAASLGAASAAEVRAADKAARAKTAGKRVAAGKRAGKKGLDPKPAGKISEPAA